MKPERVMEIFDACSVECAVQGTSLAHAFARRIEAEVLREAAGDRARTLLGIAPCETVTPNAELSRVADKEQDDG